LNHRRFLRLSLAFLASAAVALGQAATGAATPSSSPAASTSHSQTTATSTSESAAKPAPAQAESNVPAETPVLTLNGVCDVTLNGTAKTPVRTTTSAKPGAANTHSASASAAGVCKTEITRAEFDKLIKTVAPTAPASARRQIAARYVQFLTAANEGIKLGVDKDPAFPEQLALMRLQLLAQEAERKLQTDASNVTDADAKTYYDQNPSAFEEVTLTRIFIPRAPEPAPAAGAQATPTSDAEATAKAARDQLAVGGDPEKIQKSAYDQLKNPGQPPSTKFGAKRRGVLPSAQEQKVFALKSGEVSDVITDSVGYVIYRVDSKEQVPFDQAKDQAKQRITQQRLQDARQQITGGSKPDYNDAYFGPETANAAPPRVPPAQRENAAPAANSSPTPAPNPPQYPVNTQTPTPVTNQPQHSQPATPKK
jgi:parvulin-like peptidyl-prolyl isomerase